MENFYVKPIRQLCYKVKLGGVENTDEIVRHLKEKGFSYVNGLITQVNFPLKPHEIENVEIEIIDPSRSFTEDEGLFFLKTAGLEAPTEEDAIRFTEQCGAVTTDAKPYVVFLHKPRLDWDLDPSILYLDRRPGYLRLNLLFLSDNWFGFNDNYVIAGVRRL